MLSAFQILNKLAISSDKKTVTTGTGNRWRDVYRFVEPHGVLVVGGRVDMVGVGGYMLGGMNLTQNPEYAAVIKTYRPGDRWCQSLSKHLGSCIGPCVTLLGTLRSITLITVY